MQPPRRYVQRVPRLQPTRHASAVGDRLPQRAPRASPCCGAVAPSELTCADNFLAVMCDAHHMYHPHAAGEETMRGGTHLAGGKVAGGIGRLEAHW